MIKHIIFDLGNVILRQKISFGGDYFAEIIPGPVERVHSFYRNYKKDMVSGAISFRKILELAQQEFKVNTSVDDLYQKLMDNYIKDVEGVDPEIIRLIDSLIKNYSVYVMTNTIEPHFQYWSTLGFNKYFKRIFRSDTDHFMKPEREAYEFVVNAIDAEPDECVFIDDLEKNVKGAESLGIRGIVYRNSTDLVRDLVKIGVAI